MKRFLMVLIMVFMTITISACASSNQAADPNVSITPAPTVTPAATTAATADVSKVSASPAPTATATATATVTATATATAEATNTASPAPASSSKAPAATASDTLKASDTPASPQAVAPAPSASTPEPAQAEVSPKGKKVLLVGRDSEPLPAEDVAIADRLKGMGFNVTHLSDRELTADATKGYDLIYISQTTNSKFLKTGAMKEVAIPTVYVKSHGMFYLGLSSQEEGTTVKKLKSVEIVDSKHKVAGGLSGTVDVYTETGDNFGVSYGIPGKEAKVIATVPGDHTKAALYYYDKGAKADNGYEVKARLSYYYWSNGMQDTSTDAGWKLWDNIVLWTLQNG